VITRIAFTVAGRPAPQGSKKLSPEGNLLEQSPYLRAWRAAIKRAAYAEFLRLDVMPSQLPLLRGAVVARATFRLGDERRIDGPPDLDKLLRSTWDALTLARVWEDDGRVVVVAASKVHATPWLPMGADVEVELAG
jgi:Holliday junction resolvase RusA-like endonuclease